MPFSSSTTHNTSFTSRLIFRQARVPRYWKESPAYWHHIATTWSSATAKWKIYLDGSLVSIMHDVAASSTIPAGGQLLLGTICLAALYRVYKKKLNKPEIAHRLCKAPQCTTFFIEIGCLGTDNVV